MNEKPLYGICILSDEREEPSALNLLKMADGKELLYDSQYLAVAAAQRLGRDNRRYRYLAVKIPMADLNVRELGTQSVLEAAAALWSCEDETA